VKADFHHGAQAVVAAGYLVAVANFAHRDDAKVAILAVGLNQLTDLVLANGVDGEVPIGVWIQ